MSKQHCISRHIDNSRPCDGVPCYGALEIVGLLLLLFSNLSFSAYIGWRDSRDNDLNAAKQHRSAQMKIIERARRARDAQTFQFTESLYDSITSI